MVEIMLTPEECELALVNYVKDRFFFPESTTTHYWKGYSAPGGFIVSINPPVKKEGEPK